MGTVIRPEISKKNKYYISKHRYYELKHYCLQYPEFKRIYNELCEDIPGGIINIVKHDGAINDDEKIAVRQKYLDQIELIEKCCLLANPVLSAYILKGVTEGRSYNYLFMHDRIPCGKDMYYDAYRKFYYILSRRKQALL